jgi:hypothetical protein
MKWKHKQTGWLAQTRYYHLLQEGVIVNYKVNDQIHTFVLPIELVRADENWEEMSDDRWLEFSLTAKQFMEAFVMTIDPSGCNHDSLVMKQLIDRMYVAKDKKSRI